MLKTSLVGVPWVEVLAELMGLSQNRKITWGLMKMRNLLNFSSDRKRLGKPLRWWTFGEPGGVIRVFIPLRMSLLIIA